MDTFDCKILKLLQADSSVSNALIGSSIGLSASQVSRRRAKLEADGIICCYRAQVSAEALGLTLNAFVKVRLHSHSKNASTSFKTLVKGLPAIRLACAITGDADYLLHVQVKDLNALSKLISEELLVHTDVREVRSDVVLDMLKDDASIAFD